MSTVDYRAINLDPSKPYEEYSWQERRAHLLERISELGTPSAVSRTRQAEQFDVTPGQISQDIDRLGESLDQHLDSTSETLELRVLRERVVRELLDEDDWRATVKAWDVSVEFAEWLGVEQPLADAADDNSDGADDGDSEVNSDEHRVPAETRQQLTQFIEASADEAAQFQVEQGTDSTGEKADE